MGLPHPVRARVQDRQGQVIEKQTVKLWPGPAVQNRAGTRAQKLKHGPNGVALSQPVQP